MHNLEELLNTTQPIESRGSLRFECDDLGMVWFVRRGSVNLFHYRKEGDNPGRLSHFLRVQAGEAFFGVGSNQNSGMLAIGEMNPEVMAIRLSSLGSYLSHADFRKDFCRVLDIWISKIVCGVPPKKHLRLTAGPDQETGEYLVVAARNEVLWMRHHKGKAMFMDAVAVAPGEEIPLTKDTFLCLETENTVSTRSAEDLFGEGTLWTTLERFHGMALSLFRESNKQNESREKERIQEKIQKDELLMEHALFDFGNLLSGRVPQIRTDAIVESPLFAAAALVARETGVELNPAAIGESKKNKDPLGVITRAANIRKRQVILTDRWWRGDNGPLLGFTTEGNEPVALLPTRPTQYRMVNPSSGVAMLVDDENQAELKPQAIMFYRPLPNHALKLGDLLKHARRGLGREMATLVGTGILSGMVATIVPYATGVIFDRVIPEAAHSDLGFLTMGLLVVGFASLLFALTRSYALLRFEGKVDSCIQAAIWDRILSLPVPFFRDYSAGDLVTRAMSIDTMRRAISGTLITSLLAGIFSIFYFIQLFYFSWRLALIGMLLVGLALVPLIFGLIKLRLERRVHKIEGELFGLVLQLLNGIAKLRVSGSEDRAFVRWARLFRDKKDLNLRAGMIDSLVATWNSAYGLISLIGIFGFMMYLQSPSTAQLASSGAASGDSSQISVGQFLAFFTAFNLFLGAVLELSNTLIQVLSLVPVYERARPILEAIPEQDDARSQPGELSGAMEINNLDFCYEADGPKILDKVSIAIKPGEFTALVGPSGSGKSTLFRLMLGFEKPESGGIYYDGQDLSGLDVSAVRRQIGVVLQNGKLIPGSLFDNIVGSLPLSIEDAWEAAAMAGLELDIKEMPMGMHTMITGSGGTLSGGQVQRLLISRALASKPRILFFDEATSALDNQTQAIVTQSLDKLRVTRVVIAHRLSTILRADRIFVMANGRLLESGTYDELIALGGTFSELARRQIA